MYEITIHTSKIKVDKALEKIQDVLKKIDKEERTLNSFEGEMSTYIYLEMTEKEKAENIVQELKKIKEIENVYLKQKGSLPS
ncbi:hypothetical protein LB467_14480 [Salegentibacter sp. JZCK2]|uniref:hypothetical protein n=1 Tax=Salegentibacter tibetensis TaxID=2873600 RepID=UPI001CCB93DB|nr:hypothetical protein [Salegentibacter tibetensis]MBZ9730899.1 hypothetical protein [Salegentibacter tibetensis]